MAARMFALLAAVLLVAACSDPPKESEPEGPSPEDALREKWQKDIDTHAALTLERPPLGEPVTDGSAADAYKPALGATSPTQADPEKKNYADNEDVRVIADAVLAGARAKDGKLRLGEEPLKALGRPDKVIISLALVLNRLGRRLEAANYLLAQIRMFDDAARSGDLAMALHVRQMQHGLTNTLGDIATKLSAKELKEVLHTFQIILTTTPTIGLALDNEIMSLAVKVMADREFSGRELGLPVDKALTALGEHRAIAKLVDTLAAKPLKTRITEFEKKSCAIEGNEDRCKTMSRYLIQYAIGDSDLRFAFVAMAVVLHGKIHHEPPKTVMAMEANTVPFVPRDPMTGAPFDIEIADSIVTLQRAPLPKGTTGVSYSLVLKVPAPVAKKIKRRRK